MGLFAPSTPFSRSPASTAISAISAVTYRVWTARTRFTPLILWWLPFLFSAAQDPVASSPHNVSAGPLHFQGPRRIASQPPPWPSLCLRPSRRITSQLSPQPPLCSRPHRRLASQPSPWFMLHSRPRHIIGSPLFRRPTAYSSPYRRLALQHLRRSHIYRRLHRRITLKLRKSGRGRWRSS